MIRVSNIVTFCLLYIGVSTCAFAQPDFTHVNQVNAAGNATVHWDPFVSVAGEEFWYNEIKVLDLTGNLLNSEVHIIGPDINTGVLPTGWVMPTFLYNGNAFAHCFVGEQITTLDGGTTLDSSPTSQPLCSIHISAVPGATAGEVDLTWNSPYALSGLSAGGDFYLEKLNEITAVWDTIAIIPDNPLGGSFTDNPGPCTSLHVYRVRQYATNGEDIHESNSTDLITGSGNNSVPTTTHVDVDPASGLAVVHFDYEVTDETLGYIIYKCNATGGSSEVLQIGDPNATSATIPTSLASTEPESYRVAAYDCINDDGTPNPNAAGDCTSSIFTVATQVTCMDKAHVNWTEPIGMDGDVNTYSVEYSIFDDASGLWSSWMLVEELDTWSVNFFHDGVNVDQTYRYRVVAESTTGNIARSNSFEISFVYPDAPENPVLSRASVMTDGSVEIVIETDPAATEIYSYQIERLFAGDNSWVPILEPQLSSLGIPLTFVDTSAKTDEQSYSYRCIVTNECGAEVAISNLGKTILLQGWRSEDPEAFLNNLLWSQYEEFPLGVGSYEILRSSTRFETPEPLSSHPWNQNFTEDYIGDLLDEPGDFCYTVVAIENDAPSGINGAKSNRVCLTEEPLIWIPDAFTPNGDDLNDWYPWNPGNTQMGFVSDSLPSGNPVFDMLILSRWGDTVFESNDVNTCWDGTLNGDPVPDGVYSAVIRILDGSGKWHVISQSVQVLRP